MLAEPPGCRSKVGTNYISDQLTVHQEAKLMGCPLATDEPADLPIDDPEAERITYPQTLLLVHPLVRV